MTTEAIAIANDSLINIDMRPGAVGNGGSINITTGSLLVNDGARLAASTFGQGNAGNVTIATFDTVSFDGVGSNQFPSGAFNDVAPLAVGNGSDINLTTGSLSLTNGAQVSAAVVGATEFRPGGQGNGGSIHVEASDSIEFLHE